MAKNTDPMIIQLGNLKSLNIILKKQALSYYICKDGLVYIDSKLDFLEKYAYLDNIDDFNLLSNCIIEPIALTSFCTKFRKTTTTALDTVVKIDFEDKDRDTRVSLPRVQLDPLTIYNKLMDSNIIGSENSLKFMRISDSDFIKLQEGDSLDLRYIPGYIIYISRGIFGDMKKTEYIEYSIIDWLNSEDSSLTYGLFKQREPLCTIYTILAFLNVKE